MVSQRAFRCILYINLGKQVLAFVLVVFHSGRLMVTCITFLKVALTFFFLFLNTPTLMI